MWLHKTCGPKIHHCSTSSRYKRLKIKINSNNSNCKSFNLRNCLYDGRAPSMHAIERGSKSLRFSRINHLSMLRYNIYCMEDQKTKHTRSNQPHQKTRTICIISKITRGHSAAPKIEMNDIKKKLHYIQTFLADKKKLVQSSKTDQAHQLLAAHRDSPKLLRK